MEYFKGIKVSEIAEKYEELKSVWKVGAFYGLKGQSIHAFLSKEGIIRKMNIFTDDDYNFLKENYSYYRNNMKLKELASLMGRTTAFLNRKAKELGLTNKDKSTLIYSEDRLSKMSEDRKKYIKENGHPKGMKGKNHTDNCKEKMSIASKNRWENNRELYLSDEAIRIKSDNMMCLQKEGKLGVRSRTLCGEIHISNKVCLFKSSWEYNFALYVQHLKDEKLIDEWEYEPISFSFKYNTLGVRTYKPDFRILRKNGEHIYVEIKGWEDKKYKIKRDLMNNEYPNVNILYIKEREYKMIDSKYKDIIIGWNELRCLLGIEYKKCSIEECQNKCHSKGLCRHHFYEKFGK